MRYFHFVKNPVTKSILEIITRSRARENKIILDEEKNENNERRFEYVIYEDSSLTFDTNRFDKIVFIMDNTTNHMFKKLQLILKKKLEMENSSRYDVYDVNEKMCLIIVPQINFDILRLTPALELLHRGAETEKWTHIAVNCSMEKYRTYFEMKAEYRRIFDKCECSTTFFTTKQIEVNDIDEINEILKIHHSSILGGHRGFARMQNTIKRLYSWPSMSKDIKKFIEECAICEKTKIHRHAHTPLQITSVSSAPFEKIYTDFVGEINPNSSEGHKYIMTISCDLTKYIRAVPLSNCTAISAARTIVEQVCLVFNIPKTLVSDNGPAFVAETFKEMAKLLNIKHIQTTPYHPQSNGGIERYHRTMGQYLRAFVQKEPDNWHNLLPYFMFSYNGTVNSATGFTPHELVFGYDIQIPSAVQKSRPNYNYDSYKHELQYQLKNAQKRAKEMLEKQKIKNKSVYDTAGKKSVVVHNDKLKLAKANYDINTPPPLVGD